MLTFQVMTLGGRLDSNALDSRAAEQLLGVIPTHNGRRSWGKLRCPMTIQNTYSNRNYNVGKAPYRIKRFKNV